MNAMNIEFFITSLIVVFAPGTGVLYTIGVGLSQGRKQSIAAAFGCTLGILPHLGATILGLAALLHTSAMAYQIFKFVGLLYLFYLAWMTLREKGALSTPEKMSPRRLRDIIVTGFLINILNPKLSIFFLAFLPQFVPANTEMASLHLLGLGAIFMGLTFVVFVGYGQFAALMRNEVISRPNVIAWLRRTFAGAFALLGLRLAFSER